MRAMASLMPASAFENAWAEVAWFPAICLSPFVTATYEMPSDVRRKRTRSAMIIALPLMSSLIPITPWGLTLPPPGERVASDHVCRVHGLRRIVDIRGSVEPRGIHHGALIDEPAHDVRLVRGSTAREIDVPHADHDS